MNVLPFAFKMWSKTSSQTSQMIEHFSKDITITWSMFEC